MSFDLLRVWQDIEKAKRCVLDGSVETLPFLGQGAQGKVYGCESVAVKKHIRYFGPKDFALKKELLARGRAVVDAGIHASPALDVVYIKNKRYDFMPRLYGPDLYDANISDIGAIGADGFATFFDDYKKLRSIGLTLDSSACNYLLTTDDDGGKHISMIDLFADRRLKMTDSRKKYFNEELLEWLYYIIKDKLDFADTRNVTVKKELGAKIVSDLSDALCDEKHNPAVQLKLDMLARGV